MTNSKKVFAHDKFEVAEIMKFIYIVENIMGKAANAGYHGMQCLENNSSSQGCNYRSGLVVRASPS